MGDRRCERKNSDQLIKKVSEIEERWEHEREREGEGREWKEKDGGRLGGEVREGSERAIQLVLGSVWVGLNRFRRHNLT